MDTKTKLLDAVEIETGPAPRWSVVWLHGLGADADVWDRLLPHVEDRWRWTAVDQPGHGRSAPLPRYSFGGLAAAVAAAAVAVVSPAGDPDLRTGGRNRKDLDLLVCPVERVRLAAD